MPQNALPDDPTPAPLRTVPLDQWHRHLGARMVPFAGYAMPVQYDLSGDLLSFLVPAQMAADLLAQAGRTPGVTTRKSGPPMRRARAASTAATTARPP